MTGSGLLDLVLILVLLGYAVSGFRQGFVAALFGLVGLVGGAFLAVRFAPQLLEEHTDIHLGTLLGTVVVVGAIFFTATLAQAVMLALVSRLRDAVRSSRLRLLDSLAGALAVALAAVLVIWVLAGAVRTGGPASLRSVVASSSVVRAIDDLVPPQASRAVDGLTQALDRGGFPRVFEGLGPEPIAAVPAPDTALAQDPQVRRALRSVIHVRADVTRCSQVQVGSGWVLSRGRVVTNAHVVAGASSVTVDVDGTGREYQARVVVFDPRRDIAVLDAPGLPAAPLALGPQLGAGADAVIAGFPGDRGLWVGAARVRSVLEARGADIYGSSSTLRQIYSLRATVRQGASGGPVLDGDGRVVGMVFATSLDDPETGYALTRSEIQPVLTASASTSAAVPTGACTRE